MPSFEELQVTRSDQPNLHPGVLPTCGLLVLDKPSGITSRRVVDQVAALRPGMKAGHAGTLDPLASGVLVVCLGAATRLVENIQELPKSYRAEVRLGATSDTLDADGRIDVEEWPRIPTRGEVEGVLPSLSGEVAQKPPDYSAKKVKGRRAYDLARSGMAVDLAPRVVRIDRISVIDYTWPRLVLDVECGSGTYIRSLARDIGLALKCGGLIDALRRTRIGPFTSEQAVSAPNLSAETLRQHLRPAVEAVADWPRATLDADQIELVRHGRKLDVRRLRAGSAPLSAGNVALVDSEGQLIALAEIDPEQECLHSRKVLV
jgi:tRNA pseudouridine55 synthase